VLTIGEAAAATGVPATTLRYYDRMGLVRPGRGPGGRRRYPPEALDQLRFIRMCQALGCSLDEVAVIMGPAGAGGRAAMARRKLADAEARIAELETVAAALRHLAECPHNPGDERECGRTVRDAMARSAERQRSRGGGSRRPGSVMAQGQAAVRSVAPK
jgi:DNA-binding transcriptional MerR regulator